jgi:ribosomal protein S11
MRHLTDTVSVAFALAVAGTLGFGTVQAVASPAAAAAAAPRCDDRICTFQCGSAGGREIARGICICCPPG